MAIGQRPDFVGNVFVTTLNPASGCPVSGRDAMASETTETQVSNLIGKSGFTDATGYLKTQFLKPMSKSMRFAPAMFAGVSNLYSHPEAGKSLRDQP
jgi:hypothetical protein